MDESEIIKLIRVYVDGLFPKVCGNCGRQFATLKDFVLSTEHAGSTVSYDAEAGDWSPAEPRGIIGFVNCPCGSTLAIGSSGMPPEQMRLLLDWVRIEMPKRGMTSQELLTYLRDEICTQVLAEPEENA